MDVVTSTIGKASEGVVGKISQDLYEWIKNNHKRKKFEKLEKVGEIYQEYLINGKKEYSQIKTLLYRNEPKDLTHFYECAFLEREIGGVSSDDSSRKINTVNSSRIFSNNRIIITGTGGIGKSLLMKYIFVDQIKRDDTIPIFIDLKRFNTITDLERFDLLTGILEAVNVLGLKVEKDELIFTLERGVYTLLFDGYDELASNLQQTFQNQVLNLSKKYSDNQFIISSRPFPQAIGWDGFSIFKVAPLTKEQSISLIKKLEYEEKVKDNFIGALNNGLYESHESFASIPLLLNVMLMTFTVHASIPENFTDFYSSAFDTLYSRHDASKGVYTREKKANLSEEEFREIISYIAMQTFMAGKIRFSADTISGYIDRYKQMYNDSFHFKNQDFISDAIDAACVLIKEGNDLYFSHRTFQEYFSAIGVSKLTDDKQKKLLGAWQKEYPLGFINNGTFISSLVSIQKDRTDTNLFVPMVEELELLYKKNGIEKLVGVIFNSIRISKDGVVFEILVAGEYESKFPHIGDLERFLLKKKSEKSERELELVKKFKQYLTKGKRNTNLVVAFNLSNLSPLKHEENAELAQLAFSYARTYLEELISVLINKKEEIKQRNKTTKRNVKNILNEI